MNHRSQPACAPFEFYGALLPATMDADGTIWVPLRHLCREVGIDYSGQLFKVTEHPALGSYLEARPILLPDGRTYEMSCLREDAIPAWLLSINPARVRNDVRERILRYQELAARDQPLAHGAESYAVESRDNFPSHCEARSARTPSYSSVGYVYLLRSSDGYYKIGRSRNPRQRARRLTARLPFPVTLLHSVETSDTRWAESYVHTRLAQYRLNGEWFELPDDVVAWFRSLEVLERPSNESKEQ